MPKRFNETAVLAQMPDMRIAKRTAKEMICDKLESLIASGMLQVGDELPGERDLASMLAVSRETMRGAIQILAGRGLVEVSQGTRSRVASADVRSVRVGISNPNAINSYNIEAVHGARLLVERSVVAEAAERIDADTLARLDTSLVTQQEMMGDPVRFLICDREFHAAIYRCGSNRLLSDFVTDLYTYMMEYRRAAISQPGAIRRSYEDHMVIVAALHKRDSAAVVAAFDRHIERIYDTTLKLLDRPKGAAGMSGRRGAFVKEVAGKVGAPDIMSQ